MKRVKFKGDKDYITVLRYKDHKKNSEVVFDPSGIYFPGFDLEKTPELSNIDVSDCQKIFSCIYNLEDGELFTTIIKRISKLKVQQTHIIQNSKSMCFSGDSESVLYVEQNKHGRPWRVKQHFLRVKTGKDPVIFEELDERFYMEVFNTKCGQYSLLHSNSKSGNRIYLTRRGRPALCPVEGLESSKWVPEFCKISVEKDQILSFETNSSGMFVVQEHWVEKVGHCFRILFLTHAQLNKGIEKAKMNPVYTDGTLFEHLFQFSELAYLNPEVNIQEMDIFDSMLILYCSIAGDNKIVRINLPSDLSVTKKIVEQVSFEEIRFADNQMGMISPATNSELNPSHIQFEFDNTFNYSQVYKVDLNTNKSEMIVPFEHSGKAIREKEFEIRQINYPSRDGTLIPLSLVLPKKLNLGKNLQNSKKNQLIGNYIVSNSNELDSFINSRRNCANLDKSTKDYVDMEDYDSDFNMQVGLGSPQKVLVQSYGVYGIQSEVGFKFSNWNYLENDYILAYPHLRGGTDLGVDWHRSAMKKNKISTVLDLLDCFHFLIGSLF